MDQKTTLQGFPAQLLSSHNKGFSDKYCLSVKFLYVATCDDVQQFLLSVRFPTLLQRESVFWQGLTDRALKQLSIPPSPLRFTKADEHT